MSKLLRELQAFYLEHEYCGELDGGVEARRSARVGAVLDASDTVLRKDKAVAAQNPYDFISDVKDPKLFAGRRSELDRVKEELARLAGMPGVSPVVALVGERRVGKTSLLHRISEIARSQNILPCWIHLNGTLVSDAWEYWHEVLQAIVAAGYHAGAIHVSEPTFGFHPAEPTSGRLSGSRLPALSFATQYAIRQQTMGASPALP